MTSRPSDWTPRRSSDIRVDHASSLSVRDDHENTSSEDGTDSETRTFR